MKSTLLVTSMFSERITRNLKSNVRYTDLSMKLNINQVLGYFSNLDQFGQ